MYLAISGNIGSGKSTLTRMLSEHYGLTPVYEAIAENPYLEDFYRDMARYSFHSQVFFLARRLEQHLRIINTGHRVIQDRTVFEDAHIFAKNLFASSLMSSRDWQTYTALFEGIVPALRTPDLLIHISASLPTLQKRIAKRGRDYEQKLPAQYLERLGHLYEAWILGYTQSPLIVIEGDELDFVNEEKAFAWICNAIETQGLGKPLLQ
ncbi:MAG: deoxynucleoside kinase [Deinococcaceae bacterium]